MTAESQCRSGRDNRHLRVTRTAAPRVYFHRPVFTGERRRCQRFSVERLQSHHNYCWGGGEGFEELGRGPGMGESGRKRKRGDQNSCCHLNSCLFLRLPG